MNEIPIKIYIRYLFVIAIVVFLLNKIYLRPLIIESNFSGLFLIFTYSIPNFIEAIIGTLLLTGILLQIRQYFIGKIGFIREDYIHMLAVIMASFYVISQELKFHNLGGNNIYDPYDVIASIIGLVMTWEIIQFFGFSDRD